jgi:DHA2 family multidrug resistance protein
VLFTLASVACGAATSLPMLIIARVIQGAGGGALQPIAQAVLLESFPPKQRGPAMAAYGMGVIVAPIIGPTLGGWITDNYSWRWIFYINLPVGIAAVLMSNIFVEDPPYLKQHRKVRMDYIGFGLMAIGLAALQILLDKGEEEDWFASNSIRWLAVFTMIGLAGFIIRELVAKEPLVDLRIFKDRNFAAGTVMITAIGGILYGTTALLPLFLQTLLGYPALQSGLAVSPRGIGSFISTLLVGRLIGRIDTRVLLLVGFLALAWGTSMFAKLDLDISPTSIVWPNIVNGLALGLVFVPLTTTTMGTLANEQVRNATGIYNLMRNIGGSVGIAAVTSVLTRASQRQQVFLAGHLTPTSPEFQSRLRSLSAALAPRVGLPQARPTAMAILYQQLQQQSRLLGFLFDFGVLSLLAVACVVGLLLFRRVRPAHGAIAAE